MVMANEPPKDGTERLRINTGSPKVPHPTVDDSVAAGASVFNRAVDDFVAVGSLRLQQNAPSLNKLAVSH